MRPVGKAHRFIDILAHHLVDQRLVTDLIAIAKHHRRHLGIKYRVRDPAAEMDENLDILTGGVKHLDHAFVLHQVEQRGKVNALGQRINRRTIIGCFGACQLHKAKLRPIGRIAHELGIDRDIFELPELFAQRAQFFCICNWFHKPCYNIAGRDPPVASIWQLSCAKSTKKRRLR